MREAKEEDEIEPEMGQENEGRKSAYKKYRKSEKEGEEKEEIIVWEYDLKFPYQKPRARTP
jgi:hypothetical protein